MSPRRTEILSDTSERNSARVESRNEDADYRRRQCLARSLHDIQHARLPDTVVRVLLGVGSDARHVDRAPSRPGGLVDNRDNSQIGRRAAVEIGPRPRDVRRTVARRSIAHELGHLLLGSGHTSAGIMRRSWTLNELRWPRPGDWQFTKEQVAALTSGWEIRAREVSAQPATSTRPGL
jgi:hypothetical protein